MKYFEFSIKWKIKKINIKDPFNWFWKKLKLNDLGLFYYLNEKRARSNNHNQKEVDTKYFKKNQAKSYIEKT